MAEPIKPFQPQYPQPQAPANIPALAQQMQSGVLELADKLQKVLEDPSLAEQPAFLSDFAQNGAQLNRIAEQALTIRG